MNIADVFNKGGSEIKNPAFNPKSKKNTQPPTIIAPAGEQNTGSIYSDFLKESPRLGHVFLNANASEQAKKLQKYGLTLDTDDDNAIKRQLAEKQSNWKKAGNALAQTLVSEIGLGTLRGISDLFDLIINRGAFFNNNDYTNPVSEKIKEWQEAFDNNVTPIYQDPDKSWSDFGWWMSNIPSIMSSLTLMIPGEGLAMGISKLGRVSGFISDAGKVGKIAKARQWATRINQVDKAVEEGKTIGALGKFSQWANKAETTERANRFLHFGLTGSTSRLLENYQESNQVYSEMLPIATKRLNEMKDDEYDKYVKHHEKDLEGVDTTNKAEVAKAIAKKSADETFIDDLGNAVFDIYQLYGLRNLKQFMNGKNLTKVTRAHKNTLNFAAKSEAEMATELAAKPFYKKALANTSDFLYGGARQFTSELSEGLEEAVNYIAQEEGMRYGKVLLDLEKNDTSFGERLTRYMSASPLWESAFWGVVGGVVFQNLGSLATRAKRSYDLRNETKKGEDTNESVTTPWFRESREVENRINDVNSRFAQKQLLLQKLNQIYNENKDPYRRNAETGKEETLNSEEEKDAAAERAWSDFQHQLLTNSMMVGNFNLTRSFLESNEVKQAFIDSGIVSEEEAVKRQAQASEIADKIQQSYDRNMRAISNALVGINAKTGQHYRDIPFEYYNMLAFENMQHEHLADLYQTKIDSYTPSITSEEERLTPDANSTESNPLFTNGISAKAAIRSYILSEQLANIDSELAEMNKAEKNGRSSTVADNRTISGQAKKRELELRRKVLLDMIGKEGNITSIPALAITALRAAKATVMTPEGYRALDVENDEYKKFDELIIKASTKTEGTPNESLKELNEVLKDANIHFNNEDEVAEAEHQAKAFNEAAVTALGENGLVETLDKFSKTLKDNYAIITYNEIEKNTELAKIAKDRDSILLAAHNYHNEMLDGQLRKIFIEQQNETLKRLAKDYTEDNPYSDVSIGTLLANAPFNNQYDATIKNIMSAEDYKDYKNAINNLALTNPVNSLLVDFIEKTIDASETDDFVDVINKELGLVNENENSTNTTDTNTDNEQREISTRNQEQPESLLPKKTNNPKDEDKKSIKTSENGQRINFGAKLDGTKRNYEAATLFLDEDTNTLTTIQTLDTAGEGYTSPYVKTDPNNPNVVELDYKRELSNDPNYITDDVFTNKELFITKHSVLDGATVVKNPVVEFDNNGNITNITPGIIDLANSNVDDSSTGELNLSDTDPKTDIALEDAEIDKSFESETNFTDITMSDEDYDSLVDDMTQSSMEYIASKKLEDLEFDEDELQLTLFEQFKDRGTEDDVAKIISEVLVDAKANADALNLDIKEKKDIVQFIEASTKLDKAKHESDRNNASALLDTTLNNILDSYAKRAYVATINGKKVISLENLLRYCIDVTGNEAFADVLYDKFVDSLKHNDNYDLVESLKKLKNKQSIINSAKISSDKINAISKRGGKRIAVEYLIRELLGNESNSYDESHPKVKKIAAAINSLQPNSQLSYSVVDKYHIEVSANGVPIGRLLNPKVDGGSFVVNNKGWIVDIPIENDGSKSNLESLFIDIFTNPENNEHLNKAIELLNSAIYQKRKIIDKDSGENIDNPIFEEIIKEIKASGIFEKPGYENTYNLSNSDHSLHTLGAHLAYIYSHVKRRSDNWLAAQNISREEFEKQNLENRINSVKDWFNKLYDSYSTANKLFNNPGLAIAVDRIYEGGRIESATPRPVNEKGVIGSNYKGKVRVAAASITDVGTIYLSDGSTITNPNMTGGSTFITIPRKQGNPELIHAYPVLSSSNHLPKKIQAIHQDVINEFRRLLTEWSDNKDKTADDIFNFVELLCDNHLHPLTKRPVRNALFRGLSVKRLPNGYKVIQYEDKGVTKYIKLFDSHVINGRNENVSVIQFPDEKAHAFKEIKRRKEVLDHFTQIVNDHLKFNLDFGYIRGDRALSGVATVDKNGKFTIQIPNGKKQTFKSYESFVLDNGVVEVTTESKNGKTNFYGYSSDSRFEYQQPVVEFKIVNASSPVEETQDEIVFHDEEPETVNETVGDEIKDILENAIEGQEVLSEITSKLLDDTQLKIIKNSKIIQHLSKENVKFAPVNTYIASYDKKDGSINISNLFIKSLNSGAMSKEEAFRHIVHENIHKIVNEMSEQGRNQLYSELRDIFDKFIQANIKDGLLPTLKYLTLSDDVTPNPAYLNSDNTLTDRGVQELLCESLTRPEVIKRLNEIPYNDKVSDKEFGDIKSNNLLRKILSVITKLFNLKANKGSLLEREYKIFNNISELNISPKTSKTSKTDENSTSLPNTDEQTETVTEQPQEPNDAPNSIDEISIKKGSRRRRFNDEDSEDYSTKFDKNVKPVETIGQIRDKIISKNRDNFDKLVNLGIIEESCN